MATTTGNFGTAELRTQAHSDFGLCFEQGGGFDGVGGFVLGENRYLPESVGLYWNPAVHRGMALTVGGARKGKGASTVIPALLSYGGSCIAIDVKGELAWITADRRRELGQRVAILDPFNEVNRSFGNLAGAPETITRYNPLSSLDPGSPSFADDISAVVEALIWHQGHADPFFVGAARELVTGIIAAEVQDNPGMASLPSVRDWLNLDEDSLAVRCAQFCELPEAKDTLAARKLQAFGKVTKTNSAVIATCKEQLAFLDSEEMRRFLVTDPEEPFDFSVLSERPSTAYIVLPASHLETHSRFLRLCVAQSVRHVIRNRPKLSTPIVFFLDEMGTALGPMPILERSWGLTSGYGMVLWGFVQDLNQLKRDYPQSWETFVANSAMIQVIGVRDTFTSNYFSDYLGKATIEVLQASISESSSFGENAGRSGGTGYSWGKSYSQGGSETSGPGPGYGNNSSSSNWSRGTNSSTSKNDGWSTGTSTSKSTSRSVNRSEIGKPLLDPDQLRRLPSDQTLVIIPGELPYQLTRLEYFSDPRFFGLYRPDPHYPKPLPEGSKPPKQRDPAVVAAEESAKLMERERLARLAWEEQQRLLQAQREEENRQRRELERQERERLARAEALRRRARLGLCAVVAVVWAVYAWLLTTDFFLGHPFNTSALARVIGYALLGISVIALIPAKGKGIRVLVGIAGLAVAYFLPPPPSLSKAVGNSLSESAQQQAQIATAERDFQSRPKPSADVTAAVIKQATMFSHAFQADGRSYTSHLSELGVLASGVSSMTVIGIENCTNSTGGAPKGWRSIAFLLTKEATGSWQVSKWGASYTYQTKDAFLLDYNTRPNALAVQADPTIPAQPQR